MKHLLICDQFRPITMLQQTIINELKSFITGQKRCKEVLPKEMESKNSVANV